MSREPVPAFPLREGVRDKELLAHVPADVADVVAYRQLFERLVHHGDAAIAAFRVFRENAVARQGE
jgi:hypothetical protein